MTASVSAACLAVPQNMFSCAGGEDPYDYFTSFFSNSAGSSNAFRPFYYTSLLTFYTDWDYTKDSAAVYNNDPVVKEWTAYTAAPQAAVVQLVYKSDAASLARLKEPAVGNKLLTGTLAGNAAAKNLLRDKKAEAVSYLHFAKRTEAVSAASDAWEAKPRRDSLGLNRLIAEAQTGYASAADAFVKAKWAYQRCKLAFYNNRFADCIRWYDEYFGANPSAAVAPKALSYKAGSQFRLGRNKEAAYGFSKVFAASDWGKRDAFLSFLWATDNCNPDRMREYTAVAQNNAEKANLAGMFALYGTAYRLDALKAVYQLNPSSPLLPVLATREINKLEEGYLTPMLQKEPGGKELYGSWAWRGEDENGAPKKITDEPVKSTAAFFELLMTDKAIANRGLYAAGAAYLHFMAKDYAKAKSVLASAKSLEADAKVRDQMALVDLLVVANEGGRITPETESRMLPAVKWLVQKATGNQEYATFCRNFFSQIVAQLYEQQGDKARAALAYGMADVKWALLPEGQYVSTYPEAIDFVRNEMATADLLKLYESTTSPKTETEKYYVSLSSVKRDGVVDVIGTSYLRDGAYSKAVEWLSKAGKPEPLVETQYNYETGKEKTANADPLHDYLNDWQRFDKVAAKPYTKLSLAQKLIELQGKAAAPAATDKARVYYQLGSALYNMSYYGNAWNAVAYSRSGIDWNNGVYKAPWQREYYGVYKAREHYQKAYELATDKEFKAACLFMVAKCAQRQIPKPDYDYKNYEAADRKEAEFQKKFRSNPLFAQFRQEFGTTKFYQYAYNRCSYLRDYVGGGKASTAPRK